MLSMSALRTLVRLRRLRCVCGDVIFGSYSSELRRLRTPREVAHTALPLAKLAFISET